MSHPEQPADPPADAPPARGSASLPEQGQAGSPPPASPGGTWSGSASVPSAPGGWTPPEQPTQPIVDSPVSPPAGPPAVPPPPAGSGSGQAPSGPGYPMAMEPPAPMMPPPGAQPPPPGAQPPPPGVPPQPGGGHDGPYAPAFGAGPALEAPTQPAGLPPQPGAPSWQPEPAPPAGRGRSIGLVIMSVLAALLLVVSGVLGYLWWDTSDELERTRTELTAQIEELNGTVEDRDTEIDQLGDELRDVRDALSDAEIELEGTSNMVDLLEEEKDTIRECIVLLNEVYDAIEDGDVDRAERLNDQAEDVCAEADRALGF